MIHVSVGEVLGSSNKRLAKLDSGVKRDGYIVIDDAYAKKGITRVTLLLQNCCEPACLGYNFLMGIHQGPGATAGGDWI